MTLAGPDFTEGIGFGLACGDRKYADGPWADCFPDHELPLLVRGIEVTLSEDVAPSASFLGGALLGDDEQSGIRNVTYSASDLESGLTRVDALIDENVVASRDLTARCPYADYTVCSTSDEATMAIDTRTLSDGAHQLALRVQDAAGNHALISAPKPIQIANAAADREAAAGPSGQAPLVTARFGGSSRSTLIVPFARRVIVRGRLTGVSGSGLANGRIDVFERPARAGAKEVAVGHAFTRSDGTFSYPLARARPSRIVRLVYGSIVSSPALSVRVRGSSTLRATLQGTLVRFSGRVMSRPLPPRGKIVKLQGKALGYAWSPAFVTLRTDPHGRFSGSYRLKARRPGVRLRIRVRVPTERGYPYLNFVGRPIALTVR